MFIKFSKLCEARSGCCCWGQEEEERTSKAAKEIKQRNEHNGQRHFRARKFALGSRQPSQVMVSRPHPARFLKTVSEP
jgi:hypothetical protein